MASIETLSALTVPKLKDKCRELGLPVGGKKADLITRIQNKLSETSETTVSSGVSLAKSKPNTLPEPIKPVVARNKSTVKRKSSLESLPRTKDKNVSGNKKKKTGNDVGTAGKATSALPLPPPPPPPPPTPPNSAPLHPPVNDSRSRPAPSSSVPSRGNTRSLAHPKSREHKSQDGLNSSGIAKAISSTATLETISAIQPEGFQASNTTIRNSVKSTPRHRELSSYTNSRATERLKDTHHQKGMGHNKPSHGAFHTSPVGIDTIPTKNAEGSEKASTPKRRDLSIVFNQRKLDVSLPVQARVGMSRTSQNILRVTKMDGHKPPGPSLQSTSRLKAREKGNVGVGSPNENTEALIGLNKEKPHSAIKHIEGNTAIKPLSRGFKGLKLDIKSVSTNLSKESAPSFPQINSTAPTVRKHDSEISASIIRNPPRYLHRRGVERLARVLALVAFHGCSFENSLVPGHLLKTLALVSQNYRYASTLAFVNLVKLEFHGKRTQNWFKNKGIDEKVADVRLWYWYRVSERASVVKQFRTSWMERVWRFLVMALESSKPSTTGAPKPARFGLWFNGANQHLLTDPDCIGQFETSIRFWIRRFYVWVSRNGGGYPSLLQDLRDEMVKDIQPLTESDNQDLWRVETKCGDVHFIVGLTGEVIGRVEVDGPSGGGVNPGLRRTRTRIGTIVRSNTRASRIYSQINERNHTSMDNVTWENLREDWKEHASKLISSAAASEEVNGSAERLIQSVYRPSSQTVLNGIHESIKLPHHRALAERWVLAQVEPGGISGKPVLETPHNHPHKKPRLGLDLQAKLTVEGVRCSGEKWISSMNGVLAQGVGFIHTPGMGWFVLEETGQNIAQEEYGIQGLWATILGVHENGTALSAKTLEGLAEMFVMRDPLQ